MSNFSSNSSSTNRYSDIDLSSIKIENNEGPSKVIIFNTYIIPLVVENQTDGVFIELTNAIARRAGLEIKINILPTKRALNEFNANHAEVLFPALDTFFGSDNRYYKTQELIYTKRDMAFNLIGSDTIKSIAQLEGKRVSITRGYGYANTLLNNPNILFSTTSSDEFSAKMLKAGHVDAFIAERNTGIAALKRLNLLPSIQFSEQNPISELDVFYATHDTEQGRELANIIGKHIADMKKDGSFDRIMAKLNAVQ